MTHPAPTRRRFIQIAAGLSAACLWPALAGARQGAPLETQLDTHTHHWQGIALGADASLAIHHPDAATARALTRLCLDELRRLESLFSLYQPDSALCRLNRQGRLEAPAADFLALLSRSQAFSRLTGGLFDITVQPLWQAHAALDENAGRAEREDMLRAALANIGWQKIRLDPERISLARSGMALTLNGIAQGYITDRITALLAAHGVRHALVNMGEIHGLTPEEGGRPWQVGLEDARRPGHALMRLAIRNQAVATSGAYGTPLGVHGDSHLFNPLDGISRPLHRSVSVVAADATTADALSTAFSHMQEDQIRPLARRMGVQVYVQSLDTPGIHRV